MSRDFLEVRDIYKSYGTGVACVEVLKGVGFTVAAGKTVALVGPSGAGKSTLLHLLGALDRPTAGTVLVAGDDIFRQNDKALAAFRSRSVGFVFQFHHLLNEFTALENVMMPLLIGGSSRSEASGAAAALLGSVGLSHRVSHRPGELSGGEQQRVAIARALVADPALLLADEPTGNLDQKTSEGIHELLMELNAARGTTMVVVTHNEQLAGRMGRVIRLVDGEICEEGL
jgi:lipoprotein-releasing system ATP-binding protein